MIEEDEIIWKPIAKEHPEFIQNIDEILHDIHKKIMKLNEELKEIPIFNEMKKQKIKEKIKLRKSFNSLKYMIIKLNKIKKEN